MKPTIGRIVLFRVDENNTFPAIVTRAHEGTNVNGMPLINVQVFRDYGVEAMTSIYHGESVGQWSWPARVESRATLENKIVEDKTGGASVLVDVPIA